MRFDVINIKKPKLKWIRFGIFPALFPKIVNYKVGLALQIFRKPIKLLQSFQTFIKIKWNIKNILLYNKILLFTSFGL